MVLPIMHFNTVNPCISEDLQESVSRDWSTHNYSFFGAAFLAAVFLAGLVLESAGSGGGGTSSSSSTAGSVGVVGSVGPSGSVGPDIIFSYVVESLNPRTCDRAEIKLAKAALPPFDPEIVIPSPRSLEVPPSCK